MNDLDSIINTVDKLYLDRLDDSFPDKQDLVPGNVFAHVISGSRSDYKQNYHNDEFMHLTNLQRLDNILRKGSFFAHPKGRHINKYQFVTLVDPDSPYGTRELVREDIESVSFTYVNPTMLSVQHFPARASEHVMIFDPKKVSSLNAKKVRPDTGNDPRAVHETHLYDNPSYIEQFAWECEYRANVHRMRIRKDDLVALIVPRDEMDYFKDKTDIEIIPSDLFSDFPSFITDLKRTFWIDGSKYVDDDVDYRAWHHLAHIGNLENNVIRSAFLKHLIKIQSPTVGSKETVPLRQYDSLIQMKNTLDNHIENTIDQIYSAIRKVDGSYKLYGEYVA